MANPQIAPETGEIDAIARMVEMRLGVALAGLCVDRLTAVRIAPLGELTFFRELIVVMRQADHQTPLHQFITRILQQHATDMKTD
ncbi:hypothetical protein [Erwinia tracheiphila]|uniref:hypothetical protein n=2 Tax=Erwinia tracheiphila TaxID=65700 RepID=UPI001F43B4AF|nr:hypothetical protein [Erwinia tracheiphila]UIA84855.1 hypothetical protein LU604_08080 [Erwinia tracheiphila]UIA93450.1 hypothetical protein LU632_08040 [Erwinia tracheiphila]